MKKTSKLQNTWNSFVEWACSDDPECQNVKYRNAFLCFWYQSEVNNGGHLQYIENRGLEEARLALDAIKAIGENDVADILSEVIDITVRSSRTKVNTVDEYVSTALYQEYGAQDNRYYVLSAQYISSLQSYISKLNFN